MNTRLLLSPATIGLMSFLVIACNVQTIFAQDQIDTSYIKAQIDVHGRSLFNNFADGDVFAQGETVDFYGYVDGYTQIENDAQAIFTVTITDPEKETIFQQQFPAEERGGQDVVNFSYKISENAAFGIYEISFTVEKQGHKTISQYTSDPQVGYSAPRFFVSWTEQDVIDVTAEYGLEIVEPEQGDKPKEFGSGFTIKTKLCPSPIDNASDRGFYEPRADEIVLDWDQGVVIVNVRLEPLDEDQAIGVVRNVTHYMVQDGCN